jgi:hypothetical protein
MRTTMALALLLAATISARLAAQPASECEPFGDMQFVCDQEAPEDLVALPGAQWVVASAYVGSGGVRLVRVADRSSLMAYPADTAAERIDAEAYPDCPGPPRGTFTTHGLSVVPGAASVHRLFVVGHGSRESIEVFEVDTGAEIPRLTWIGCVIAPEPIGLNSVRGLPDGGFVTTNFLPRGGERSAMARMMEGEENGELWEWHTASGWVEVPGSEAAGANGVELSEDGGTVYMAAWGSQSFARLTRNEPSLARDEIPLGFRVDNIRWARDGSLLAVGQGTGEDAQTWLVVKIDPDTLAVDEVLRRPNNDRFVAGTVAVEIGDDYWVGSFRGDRIAIVPMPDSL